jgi:hypothetical protein
MLGKKISTATGTAFSRQRKNIEAKSQFLVRMRILQLVEIGVLRSSHAPPCVAASFPNSVRFAFPTTYRGLPTGLTALPRLGLHQLPFRSFFQITW